MPPRADAAFRAVAALLLASLFVEAVHDASQAWDVGYYHLPFAARLAGILGEGDLVFHPANAARLAGYPIFAERLQGLLWRVTGRAECANLVAFACVPLLAWFAKRRFSVPWPLTTIALLAVPLVQAHATSCYVDLPANAAASVVVLLAIEAHARAAPPTRATLLLAGIAAGIAVSTKAQVHPIVLAALIAIGARALPAIARARDVKTLAAIAIALPIVFATPLANLARHGNPYYPVRLSLFGHALPGPEEAYASSPPWLERASRPTRFALSLLEIGIRPLTDPRRWTIDQWMPSDSTGNRMGGFFGAYVVALLAIVAWRVARDRAREVRAAAIGFGALTAIVAVMPQSHELRYYMAWMIVLVTIDLWLACRPGASPRAASPRAIGAVSVAALAVVIASTRGAYAYPSGSTFAELVAAKVDARAIDRIRDGERVCVRRAPWNLLWAARFHPPRRYVVREAEEPEDCEGDREVP